MPENPEPDAPVPPPVSPYGPADGTVDGVTELFGEAVTPATEPAAAPVVVAAPGDTEAVTRARRTLKRLAIVLPLAGLVLSIVAIVVQVVTGGAFGIDPVSEIAGLTITFIGPTLLVLGLHMVVWRAMVRPLSRMTPGSRTGMIIGVGGVLSFVSVILVVILVFAGFMIVSLLFTVTDQAM
ncbi:MAG: hypothetical protein B7Y93_01220 [Micrococcales bacterium 32-70-13]|nr:MAG: hypothetical protein B7Y93_01220 [Micrococcales bacterium 32-70-13]